VATGTIKHKFTTGLLTGSIAVTADGRVLAVDEGCLGVFANHDPKLRVFDLSTGKRIREISGRGAGVRYLVSSSADGSRFLAFTGRVKMLFDWGDALPLDIRVDGTFSVWDLSNYAGVVTSQNLRGLNAYGLRLSPKGGYVVSIGKASFIYQLPPH
jgi:WD40 repeat protein